jgi:hypothetical protein
LAAAAALATLFVLQPFATQANAELAELSSMKERSASLESRLFNGDLGNRVMSGWEAALAAELEDRIAVIDGQLGAGYPAQAQAGQVVDLWRQRVNLMERLYTVRRAAYQGM